MSFRTLLIVYVIGGLTFVPLILAAVLAFAYFTLPRVPQANNEKRHHDTGRSSTEHEKRRKEDDGFVDKADVQGTSGADAAGYFAVCREYVPGGINGKPPERSSPAGEVLSSESPSVYQSMYRSIFDRGKTASASLEGDKKDPKAVKRPRNVFFVVLRHEHLLLFDNSDQLEVRHVISLLHHTVDVYGGGGELREDEVWVKRNCIRLTRRAVADQTVPTSQPFYIFSDNCSDKEDFYYAMLSAQANALETNAPPPPRQFEMDHVIKLVQALHTSDADSHARWINATIGRMFLAIYKTEETQLAIKEKLNRKVAQAPKPGFIVSVQVQEVDMGDAAPIFSNFKLKELMVDGSLTIEMDVKYNGGFRLQVAAVARIDLGSRIRAREVDLVLAGVLRKLSGHLFVKIKPPPSNRFWISFESMPQLDLSVEPVVSSMQITYSVILRAIESRIREVIGETLVYPNWDDSPFFDTRDYDYRGGIWDAERKSNRSSTTSDAASEVISSDTIEPSIRLDVSKSDLDSIPPLSPKSMSTPNLVPSPTKDVSSRKAVRKSATIADMDAASTSMSAVSTPAATPPRSRPTSPRVTPADKPKAMRSNSFAAAATPLVSTDGATSVQRSSSRKAKGRKEAVDFVKEVKSRSDSMTAQQRPSPEIVGKSLVDNEVDLLATIKRSDTNAGEDTQPTADQDEGRLGVPSHSKTFPLPDPGRKRASWNLNFGTSPPTDSALGRASAAAKSWGINMINRQTGAGRNSVSGFTSLAKEAGLDQTPGAGTINTTESSGNDVDSQAPEREPVGRGQPIPQSLEDSSKITNEQPPENASLEARQKAAQSLWSTSTHNLGSLKRKPVSNVNHAPSLSSSSSASMGTKTLKSGNTEVGTDFPSGVEPLEGSKPVLQHYRRTSSVSGVFDIAATPPDRAERRKSSLTQADRSKQGRRSRTTSETDALTKTRSASSANETVPAQGDGATKPEANDEEREETPPPLPRRNQQHISTTMDQSGDREQLEGDGDKSPTTEVEGTVNVANEDQPTTQEEKVKVEEPVLPSNTKKPAAASKGKGGWYTGASLGGVVGGTGLATKKSNSGAEDKAKKD